MVTKQARNVAFAFMMQYMDLLNNRTLKHSSFATQYVLRHNQGTLSLLDSIMCRVRTTVLLYDKLQHVQRSSGVLLLLRV